MQFDDFDDLSQPAPFELGTLRDTTRQGKRPRRGLWLVDLPGDIILYPLPKEADYGREWFFVKKVACPALLAVPALSAAPVHEPPAAAPLVAAPKPEPVPTQLPPAAPPVAARLPSAARSPKQPRKQPRFPFFDFTKGSPGMLQHSTKGSPGMLQHPIQPTYPPLDLAPSADTAADNADLLSYEEKRQRQIEINKVAMAELGMTDITTSVTAVGRGGKGKGKAPAKGKPPAKPKAKAKAKAKANVCSHILIRLNYTTCMPNVPVPCRPESQCDIIYTHHRLSMTLCCPLGCAPSASTKTCW